MKSVWMLALAIAIAACANEDYTPMIPVQPGAAARGMMLLDRVHTHDAGADADADTDAGTDSDAMSDGGDSG